MVLSLPFVTAHFQFITAHFVRHCALKMPCRWMLESVTVIRGHVNKQLANHSSKEREIDEKWFLSQFSFSTGQNWATHDVRLTTLLSN